MFCWIYFKISGDPENLFTNTTRKDIFGEINILRSLLVNTDVDLIMAHWYLMIGFLVLGVLVSFNILYMSWVSLWSWEDTNSFNIQQG